MRRIARVAGAQGASLEAAAVAALATAIARREGHARVTIAVSGALTDSWPADGGAVAVDLSDGPRFADLLALVQSGPSAPSDAEPAASVEFRGRGGDGDRHRARPPDRGADAAVHGDGSEPPPGTLVLALTGDGGLAGAFGGADEPTRGLLGRILAAAVARPGAPALVLPPADPHERERVRAWNATDRPFPANKPLHSLFEQRAAAAPDATALAGDGVTVSYGELDARANALADTLRRHGAKPERLVGVEAELSPASVVAMLAILKSGAAYFGIDPRTPPERLRFMIRDLGIALALARPETAAALRAEQLTVLDLDKTAARAPAKRDPQPPRPVPASQLAYAVYTSGSTGLPKAVGIEHGGALAFLHWAGTAFPGTALAGGLATTGPTLDCPLFELWAPLSHGGTAVLMRRVFDLPTAPHARAVTLVSTVPAVVTELLRARALPPTVAALNLGGDTLTAELAAQLAALPAVGSIFNHYGPSETTTYATGSKVLAEDGVPLAGAPTIGHPIANMRMTVADERLDEVPIGLLGELCIAGAGVGRGYLGRPRLTAQKFAPDPSGGPGVRIYRSGDLGRRRTDGELEFRGRRDRQVKVHGLRVEPGEVEAVLARHPAVREAAVAVRELRAGVPQVVAWVAADDAAVTAAELTRHAAAWLSPHMVPGVFVPVERLPRTRSGKVDQSALAPHAQVSLTGGAAQG